MFFFAMMGFYFAHARDIHASVTQKSTNSEDNTKVEHLITGFGSSKFATLLFPTSFFFAWHSQKLLLQFIFLPFETLLFALAEVTEENEAFWSSEHNDGEEGCRSFSRHQRLKFAVVLLT